MGLLLYAKTWSLGTQAKKKGIKGEGVTETELTQTAQECIPAVQRVHVLPLTQQGGH